MKYFLLLLIILGQCVLFLCYLFSSFDCEMILKLNQIVLFALLAFFISWALYPLYISFLKKIKAGKTIREASVTGDKSTIFSKLHKHKSGTPTM